MPSRAKTKRKWWWLYLLDCAHDRAYAGIALDVHERFRLHAAGKGAKFTRANPPRKILGAKRFASKSAALKAEYKLKQLERREKLAWAAKHPPSP